MARSISSPLSPLRVPVRRALRTAGFVSITAAMLPAYAARDAFTLEADRDTVRDRWLRRWSHALLELFAVKVDVRGDPRDRGRGRLVVANHRSTIDIAVLLRTFGGHMVSRADIGGWPVIGAAARKVGTVFVDRESAVSGASAIRAIRDLLKAGRTVCIFPEGTTFADDEVRPFHAGAFVAALRTQADVIPVGIAYERGSGAAFVGETFLAHLGRMSTAEPSRVTMCIGEPIAIEDRARAVDLRERTREAVHRLVVQARAISDHAPVPAAGASAHPPPPPK
jgi:1-acyl-sn-glycerol-3-phosphate acyltransferase